MLHFGRWQSISIVAVILLSLLVVIPNFVSKDNWPSWLPHQSVVLGLDLQGGVYLLYEVDVEDYQQRRLDSLEGEVRTALNQAPVVNYSGLDIIDGSVQVRIVNPDQVTEARRRLGQLLNPLDAGIFGGAVNEFQVNENGQVFRLGFSEAGLSQRLDSLIAQSIEVVRRRVDEFGTTEASIQRSGSDRILVEAPGEGDPTRLRELIGQTAQMTFHLVNPTIAAQEVIQGLRALPAGYDFFCYEDVTPDEIDEQPCYLDSGRTPELLQILPTLTGEDLVDASATFDQQTREPIVQFRLTASGGRTFGNLTAANVGNRFAIVLDDAVISAPVIESAILGGSAVIRGNFTVETANDLAVLLRAGALPTALTVVEERTIGPSLGEDSIRAGIIASIVATVAIAAFMILFYGLLGFFAVLALIAQNIIMLAILSLLGATLTLPGIAGIVLTMALAVDANVLIYERMREEARAGRSAVVALDQGFRRALGTIVDAHLTSLIAALALFWLGSGPIRGFAITMGIGILSTLFTAYLITRMIVAIWFSRTRPKVVPL